MTQISAIYAKRSRSIVNQFGQTNIQVNNHAPREEPVQNPKYFLSPGQNLNYNKNLAGGNNSAQGAQNSAHANSTNASNLSNINGPQ